MSVIRRFLTYYHPYRRTLLYDLLCAVTASGVDLTIPMLLNYLLKQVFPQQNPDYVFDRVLLVGAGLLVLYAIRMFAQYYVTSWGHIMGAKMETDMRSQLFSHFEKLSFSYYDKNNTGHMMSRMVADLFDIAELAHHGPEDVFISLIKLTGSFIILASINWQVTVFLILITVVMFVFSYHYNLRMRQIFMDNRRKIADVNAVVQDSLAGIRTVKSFGNEGLEREKFEQGNQRFFVSRKQNYLTLGRFHAGNGFLQGMMYLVVIVSSGFFISRGSMPVTDIIIYMMYIGMFLDPINRIVNFTEQFQRGYTGFQRMLEIIDMEPDIRDRPGAVEAGELKGHITFDQVTFAYEKEHPVLSEISLEIPAGQTMALIGPSGAGKTTFCSLIPRFYDVSAGAVRIDGVDVRDYTLDSLRRNVGVVQQDVYIFNSTIRDNIAYGRPGTRDEDIIEAARRANIHDFIMSLDDGYDTLVGERGIRFSGGQKQRLSIARVFLKNPPILILDEATSSLDNESERLVQQALADLSQNRTTLVIAHRLSTVKHADEIIVLTENGLAERGDHTSLLRQAGLYAHLYQLQFEDS
ncbi:MAG: ABC transporter ATP-binding protein [Clostridiaceae bacterium]|jgi:ATP-binding cassette subfamily B protein|nr:ABC transporter ATP-binding protein [Clostridiaceae bacterium]